MNVLFNSEFQIQVGPYSHNLSKSVEVPTDPSSKEALKAQTEKIEDLQLKMEGLVAQTEELHEDIHRLEEGKEMKQNTSEKKVEKKKVPPKWTPKTN